jgi:hypothetical protein
VLEDIAKEGVTLSKARSAEMPLPARLAILHFWEEVRSPEIC